MSRKTITKNLAFVIFYFALSASFSACHSAASKDEKSGTQNQAKESSQNYQKPQTIGKIQSAEITESSGVAASKCNAEVFWTHNDSGDGAFVFAFDKKGKHLGAWRVSNAKNTDWEDIAAFKTEAGECFLYIADIGNNSLKRAELVIYRVKEPKVTNENQPPNRKNAPETESAEAIKFSYPDKAHNAETLLVHPQTAEIYVLTKEIDSAAGVYKLPKNYKTGETNRAEKAGELTVPAIPNGLLTGGDISPDGRRVAVCDYFDGYELVLPERAKNFDEIWKQKPLVIDLGERKIGEAVTFSADGNSLFATQEGVSSPVIEVRRK